MSSASFGRPSGGPHRGGGRGVRGAGHLAFAVLAGLLADRVDVVKDQDIDARGEGQDTRGVGAGVAGGARTRHRVRLPRLVHALRLSGHIQSQLAIKTLFKFGVKSRGTSTPSKS